MATSPQHPFLVKLADGQTVGGAETAADTTVLAAALFERTGSFVQVVNSSDSSVVGQLGLERQESAPAEEVSISGINPASQATPLLQILTCTGAGFEEGAEILFDDVRQETTYDGPTSVVARINYTGAPGEVCSVQVRNPDGRVSNTLYFTFE
jgi:hypothetical protein